MKIRPTVAEQSRQNKTKTKTKRRTRTISYDVAFACSETAPSKKLDNSIKNVSCSILNTFDRHMQTINAILG